MGILALTQAIGSWSPSANGNDRLWPIAWVVLTLLFIHRFRHSRPGTSALMVQMNPDLATH